MFIIFSIIFLLILIIYLNFNKPILENYYTKDPLIYGEPLDSYKAPILNERIPHITSDGDTASSMINYMTIG